MNFRATLCILLIGKSLLAVPFWLQTIKHPSQVGALFECSSAVGEELMRYAKEHSGPKRILEIGAGKGSITRVICNYLSLQDHLDVVEIDPEYCVDLYKQFPKSNYPNVQIHCADILTFTNSEHYDYIICTLPLTVFEVGALKKFQNGEISITDLNISLGEREKAKRDYINSLEDYWRAYYNLRILTLYDFELDQKIRYVNPLEWKDLI